MVHDSKKLRILIFFVLFIIFSIFTVSSAFAVDWLPLVPCGLKEQPSGGDSDIDYTAPCTTCDFFRLGKNVIDFILFGIIPPAAVLLFIVAGFLILTAGGTVGKISFGKSIFWHTFLGLLIIFSAWLVTNTILKSFAPGDVGDKWHELKCEAGVEIIPLPLPSEKFIYGCLAPDGIYRCSSKDDFDCEDVVAAEEDGEEKNCSDLGLACIAVPSSVCDKDPSEDAQVQQNVDLARQLSRYHGSTLGVGFSTAGDCGSRFSARWTIAELAEGKFPSVCSPECNIRYPACIPTGITVNPEIMQGLIDLAQKGKEGLEGGGGNLGGKPERFLFTITSLTTGEHSSTSLHYKGNAVDITVWPENTQKAYLWQRVVAFLTGKGGSAFCETRKGKLELTCKFEDDVDHIHWSWRR